MARYLVCSDIHGELENFRAALRLELPLDGVLIAGDLELTVDEIETAIRSTAREKAGESAPAGETAAEKNAAEENAGTVKAAEIPVPTAYIVAGNNDGWYAPELPKKLTLKLGGHTIFLCHGHRFGVPRLNALWLQAKKAGADIAIFGHTHRYQDASHFGVRFLNPGKLGYNFSGLRSTYMILTLDPDGSVTAEKRILPEEEFT